jgi:hypothetical protein
MTIILAAAVGLLGVLLVARLLLTSHPASVARALRVAGPLALAVAGVGLMAIGRMAFGVPLAGGGLLWWAAQFRRRPQRKLAPPRPAVRTAAMEMALDPKTGEMEGMVLAGRHAERRLSSLSLTQLLEVYEDLRSDLDSRRLLEAYLDGRFPVWRNRTQANGGPGKRGAPGAGTMTEQEAYQILGLEAGATAADIRESHRRLVQRLDPRIAAESLLVARIDKAKAILLARHG